jgi:hypothetical protein
MSSKEVESDHVQYVNEEEMRVVVGPSRGIHRKYLFASRVLAGWQSQGYSPSST